MRSNTNTIKPPSTPSPAAMESQAPTATDLAYLEEYADSKCEARRFIFKFLAVVSLPHEIQRNFTLIREHDAKVKGN